MSPSLDDVSATAFSLFEDHKFRIRKENTPQGN